MTTTNKRINCLLIQIGMNIIIILRLDFSILYIN